MSSIARFAISAFLLIRRRRRNRRLRTIYIRDLFSKRSMGETLLLQELKEDVFYHQNYYRMSMQTLETLMNMIGPYITHRNNHAYPINIKQRLALTIRYLASGNSLTSMALSYRISPSSVSKIVPEVLAAIEKALLPICMQKPTLEEWRAIVLQFWLKWNIPNCLGAVDGKHVRIRCPEASGSLFLNYRKYFSTVLMAVADANYRFIFVDIGAYGCEGDSTVFQKSEFFKRLENGLLNIPPAKAIVDNNSTDDFNLKMEHFVEGDDAFPLKKHIMKPYAGKNLSYEKRSFNYRLSRARRVIENSFGIMSAKFRIYHTAIAVNIDTVDKIIMATCCLHNFLIDTQGLAIGSADTETNGSVAEGTWRSETHNFSGLENMSHLGSNNYARDASCMRNNLCQYFSSVSGKLSWQDEIINNGFL